MFWKFRAGTHLKGVVRFFRVGSFCLLLPLLATGPAVSASLQTPPADPAGADISIVSAQEFVLPAPRGEDALRVLVKVPRGKAPDGGYPVLYTFDAEMSVSFFASNLDLISQMTRRYHKVAPILVAIGYADGKINMTRRTFDLTPPSDHADGHFDMPNRNNGYPWPKAGGGDHFLDRVMTEVKPFIASHFPADTHHETLFGHSFGGLMVVHTLFTRPDSFDAYVASSPSLWVNAGQGLREAKTFLKHGRGKADAKPIPLLLTAGGGEEDLTEWDKSLPDDPQERLSWLRGNRMLGNVKDLAHLMSEEGQGQIDLTFQVIGHENHLSVQPISSYRAILFAIDHERD